MNFDNKLYNLAKDLFIYGECVMNCCDYFELDFRINESGKLVAYCYTCSKELEEDKTIKGAIRNFETSND